MPQGEWFTTYLQYERLNDLLNIMLYTSQSFMAITPSLYHIRYKDKEILFVHTDMVGGVVDHYYIIEEKPHTKFIALDKKTSKFSFVEHIGNNPQSIYIAIVDLIKSTLIFLIDISI